MKKYKLRAAPLLALLMAVCLLLPAASCAKLVDLINSLASELPSLEETAGPDSSSGPAATGGASEGAIPFATVPDIPEYELPDETFVDDIEEEASQAIDSAIAKAISYVNVMKDSRHSYETVPFEEDPNGYIAKLDSLQLEQYRAIVRAAENFESYKLEEKDYEGDLKALYFAIHEPLSQCEPVINACFYLDAVSYIQGDDFSSFFASIFSKYFDPAEDGNFPVDSGAITLEEVKHKIAVLDRVVDRVIRFMPEGLTAYDKYYYLAAVLSEKVTYDKRPACCYSAYGALVKGRAVCEGYSQAYYLLCRAAGLWCAYRSGLPEGIGHAWNMIQLDSGIYNVDVTWSDGYGLAFEKSWYKCFVKTDDDFEFDGHEATYGVPSTGSGERCPYE
jgi:hypothetical protein